MLRLSVISLLAAGLQAAVLAPGAAVRPRQVSSSSVTTETLGYTFALTTTNGDTVWAPYSYSYYWTTSLDSYFGFCSTTGISYDYSAASYISPFSTCNVYTTCDNGVLSADATSYQCAGEGYQCVTWELYESWGASDPETNLGCASTDYNATTSIFRTRPAAHVSEPSTASATPTGETTPKTTPATPAPTSTAPPATSTPASGGGGGGSSNTGVIAGSVVGGVAVLAIAGVAIFWIMRRSRNHHPHPDPHNQSTYAPSGVPSYYQPQSEKPADNMTMMPQYDQQQYDPHGSAVYPHNGTSPQGVGGTSPHPPQSPVPLYPEGFRGEMDGTGVPTVRTPPPHTGY